MNREIVHHIEREQLVPLPVGEAFAFFADAFNLEAITPPWLRFWILTPRPIPMSEGTSIEYRLSLHRLPFHWLTRIERFEPGRRCSGARRACRVCSVDEREGLDEA